MKRLLLTIVISIFVVSAVGQSKEFIELYNKYSKTKGLECDKIGKTAIGFAKLFGNNFPKGLTSATYVELTTGEGGVWMYDILKNDCDKYVSSNDLTVIKHLEIKGQNITIYTKECNEDNVRDMTIYRFGDRGLSIMEFGGEFKRDTEFVISLVSGNGFVTK